MAEEPEQVLPEQRVAALGRVEEMRADAGGRESAQVLASITAGIAKMIMNDVTSCAQTNSGMRLQRHARARACLKMVVDDVDGDRPAPTTSVKVISCAQKSARLPGAYCGPASGT